MKVEKEDLHVRCMKRKHLFFVSSEYFFVKLKHKSKAFRKKKSWHDLIHSKHLRDLSLVTFVNRSIIKKCL